MKIHLLLSSSRGLVSRDRRVVIYTAVDVWSLRGLWPRSCGSVLTAPPVVQRAAMCTKHWAENEDRT
ncbi:hypothetical protein PHYPO_G00054500 [Pangasianodon hypophthalmus]|uniref:Uncharacterized protein n=1 Tax=Pangasianodon hypophthalmus TaxID=310915 RepID=A0A5N5M5V6_PANHP|nr:hypothetical protein PHYPO_G00054500 [Pangasianodon hypophthalmus]